jgi:hypothetical protein
MRMQSAQRCGSANASATRSARAPSRPMLRIAARGFDKFIDRPRHSTAL